MIFCSDIHLSDKCPISRNESHEEWLNIQMNKLYQITTYADENNQKHIIIAGDFFHKYVDSTVLVNKVMEYFNRNKKLNFYIIYGNHDFKNHNPEFNLQTSLLTFSYLPNVTVISGQKSIEMEELTVDFFAFGEKLSNKGGDIAIIHQFAYKNKPWSDAPEAGNYKRVASQLSEYDLIVCGDNHERFICVDDEQIFLNCGSMTRRSIDQRNHDPQFYAMQGWEIKSIPFEYEEDVWDEKKGELQNTKEEAIKEVAKKFKKKVKVDLDFESNLNKFCNKNKIDKDIKNMIVENME